MARPTKLTLFYFDATFWRGEMCRLTLHVGGIPFEDRRFKDGEFDQMKASGAFPFGSVPILIVEDASDG